MNGNSKTVVALALVIALVGGSSVLGAAFKRGEVNGDARVNVSDAVQTLRYLFQGEPLLCLDAADYNDDGSVDIADPVGLLGYLFAGSARPPEPFTRCGPDPTPDALDCAVASCHGTGVIFFIDRSSSMGSNMDDGEVKLFVVRRMVTQALEHLPDGALASVMLVGGHEDVVVGTPPLVLNEQTRSMLIDSVANALLSSGSCACRPMERALDLLRAVPLADPRIAIYSDGHLQCAVELLDLEAQSQCVMGLNTELVPIDTVYVGPTTGNEWTEGKAFLERLAQATGGTFRIAE